MELILRPFERFLEVPLSHNVWKVCGNVVDNNSFLISAPDLGHLMIPLNVDRIGADKFGTFAVLQPQEKSLRDGWLCRLGVHSDGPDEEPGAAISITLPADPGPYVAAAKDRGWNLNQAHLIVPIRAGFTIYFGALGHVDGHSGPAVTKTNFDSVESNKTWLA